MGLCGEQLEDNLFNNRPHDHLLVLDICEGVTPEISEPEAPRCYIDLMKKCWDLVPNNRPNILEISEMIMSFYRSCGGNLFIKNTEIGMQFKKAEEFRKAILSKVTKKIVIIHKLFTHLDYLIHLPNV
ncbi:unnamed protein product [Rhizophagus irregularis]|nr:unnamed protein product [Rhizophagus irregularis]CAB5393639.1 unnamed protein product [Rhizophagus irregularis]